MAKNKEKEQVVDSIESTDEKVVETPKEPTTSSKGTTLIPPFPAQDGKVFGNGFELEIKNGKAHTVDNRVISILTSEGWKAE